MFHFHFHRGPPTGKIFRGKIHRNFSLHSTQRRWAFGRNSQTDAFKAGATRIRWRQREKHRVEKFKVFVDSCAASFQSSAYVTSGERYSGSGLHQFWDLIKILRKFTRPVNETNFLTAVFSAQFSVCDATFKDLSFLVCSFLSE